MKLKTEKQQRKPVKQKASRREKVLDRELNCCVLSCLSGEAAKAEPLLLPLSGLGLPPRCPHLPADWPPPVRSSGLLVVFLALHLVLKEGDLS